MTNQPGIPGKDVRPANRPKGYYTQKDSWSKEKFKGNFEGTWHQVYYPLIKISLLLLEYWVMKLLCSCSLIPIIACLATLLFYQDFVCLFYPNTIKMGAMDHQCYLGNPQANVNYMNASMYDHKDIFKISQDKWTDMCYKHPKLCYKVKEIYGDYYYERMSVEETVKKAMLFLDKKNIKDLSNQREIDYYVSDNLNEKIPLDGPQWRAYV